jgi:HNH endonuclease
LSDSAGAWTFEAQSKAAGRGSAGDALSGIHGKRSGLRLEPEAYRELCRQVLERDSWRCQECGGMENLHVHHLHRRSQLGSDVAENLIALCASCHQSAHRLRRTK